LLGSEMVVCRTNPLPAAYWSMIDRETQGVLTQLRAYLAHQGRVAGTRLPPERLLAGELGVSRGTLRKALADLEVEGLIWRHVGRGTFVGNRPVETVQDLGEVTRRTNPAGVMEARLSLEPELARLAALHATPADLEELAECVQQSREAGDWRTYEYWDNRLHRVVAEATANVVLLALFDSLNTIRRTVTWGRLRRFAPRPDSSHHSFAEHDRIVGAIVDRDPGAAAAAMRVHLRSVRDHLLLSAELAPAEERRA
jgi:DNA-binding FadR family transcriptional regulator